MMLSITSTEREELEHALTAHGFGEHLIRTRSGELNTILVSLGGAAGLASLLNALGAALKDYFQGTGEREKARKSKLSLKIGDLELECEADDVDVVAAKVLRAVERLKKS